MNKAIERLLCAMCSMMDKWEILEPNKWTSALIQTENLSTQASRVCHSKLTGKIRVYHEEANGYPSEGGRPLQSPALYPRAQQETISESHGEDENCLLLTLIPPKTQKHTKKEPKTKKPIRLTQ